MPFVTVSPAELRIACAAAVPSSEAVPVTVRPELVRLEFPAVNVSDVTLVKEGSEASVSVTVDASSAVVSSTARLSSPDANVRFPPSPTLYSALPTFTVHPASSVAV